MLQLRDISQHYDGQPVLRDIDLHVAQGEIICLLGASGSGKTTLLRIIAGLEPDFSGNVLLNGEPLRDVPVHQRGFGLVFQDFALFPHLTVAQNVAFGLEMQNLSEKERQNRVTEMLELVKLSGFGDRDVSQLSGGEKQRVALARSLAPRPRLLMLDEPLGSLDANLRGELVLELREIIKQMDVTAVYVTHDQEEAYAVADLVAVM
ncbi:MAG: ABC transporter ATP-binding protein, partial [Anaerolineae bacterium]|nr:ABC transporter ATP-binding protein [Anaerolineae bacterium]